MIVRVELRGIQSFHNRTKGGVVARLPAHLTEAARVPKLVAEILSTLDPILLETNILPLRRDGDDPETQTVRTIGRDQIQRVRRIPQRLRHLAPLLVPNDAGKINILERDSPLN